MFCFNFTFWLILKYNDQANKRRSTQVHQSGKLKIIFSFHNKDFKVYFIWRYNTSSLVFFDIILVDYGFKKRVQEMLPSQTSVPPLSSHVNQYHCQAESIFTAFWPKTIYRKARAADRITERSFFLPRQKKQALFSC